MKNIRLCFLAISVMYCTSGKKSEEVVSDSVKTEKDTLPLVSNATVSSNEPPETVSIISDPESDIEFSLITISTNAWLREYAMNPFSLTIPEMKEKLDSLAEPTEYQYGENGGLTYKNVEITFNNSYGETICEANIRSALLPLNKGAIIGMSIEEFLSSTGVDQPSSENANIRFEFTYSFDNERKHTVQFDFIDRVLYRLIYKTDPCVVYD